MAQVGGGDARPCVSTSTSYGIATYGIARRDALPCVSSTHRRDAVRRPRWITPCRPQAQLGVSHPLLYELRSSSTRFGVEQRDHPYPELRFACKGLSILKAHGLRCRTRYGAGWGRRRTAVRLYGRCRVDTSGDIYDASARRRLQPTPSGQCNRPYTNAPPHTLA
jgi:hypothetical protein